MELNPKYEHLPIDTRYFKDLELEILSQFDDLDKFLDGWLIKSENYQALNTILLKFKEKVQTIYIDPPFNLGKNADYFYNVNYKDASWLTLLENRFQIAKDILAKTGSCLTRCDNNGNMFVRLLMNHIFGEDNFRNEITVRKTSSLSKREVNNLERETEHLYHFCKDNDLMLFNQLIEDRKKAEWVVMQEKPNRGQTGKPIIIEGQEFKPREGWC
ncbi:MAG: DNA methyltransferase [candidate division WOR-3 bacterium]